MTLGQLVSQMVGHRVPGDGGRRVIAVTPHGMHRFDLGDVGVDERGDVVIKLIPLEMAAES